MSPDFDFVENDLKVNEVYPFPELEARLRRAPLKDKSIPDFYPYRHATITLERMKIKDLSPCALYVLEDHLNRARNVQEALFNKGIDIFNLDGAKSLVSYDFEDRKNIEIVPPIIEVSADDDGKRIVVDGLHRVAVAKGQGYEDVVAVKVEGVAIPLPSFPVGWDEVKIVNEVPQIKRRYRIQSMEQIRKWEAENYSRFIQGFDFPEFDWKRGIYPEYSGNLWYGNERAAAIVTSGDKILLVQRADSGLWGLPSGGVEKYDQRNNKISGMPARRELFEETGLVALEWRLISHVFKEPSKTGWIYEMRVIDGVHVDMKLEDYILSFNKGVGNAEVSGLGLFSLKEIQDLERTNKLFKPEYNLVAVENYVKKRADGSLEKVPNCSPWDAPNVFWEHQESFPYFPARIKNGEDLMRQIEF